jgi:hypothetical protein
MLSYYMNLHYKIETLPVEVYNGGGYESSIVGFEKKIYGFGYTEKEALKSLRKAKKNYFLRCLILKVVIPKPEDLYE